MTLLGRTEPTKGYPASRCCWRRSRAAATPSRSPLEGMSGGEIQVLGYRGMKEYELFFDGFERSGEGLLGGVEGQGFKQLMGTFKSARIQTAARAVGVAQSALELGLRVRPRARQFAKPITLPARRRQAGLDGGRDHAGAPADPVRGAREGQDRRCDIEAGMAKLLAAHVALEHRRQRAADPRRQRLRAGVRDQPRAVRCTDPQHLRGPAEIQAQVIARRLLAG